MGARTPSGLSSPRYWTPSGKWGWQFSGCSIDHGSQPRANLLWSGSNSKSTSVRVGAQNPGGVFGGF